MGRQRKIEVSPAATRREGGCFVTLAADWGFWNGSEWVARWEDAQQFAGPGDPYTDCLAVVTRLRGLGERCSVAYVPSRIVRLTS